MTAVPLIHTWMKLSVPLRWAQAATDHYQVLLDEGAAVPGSLADARLTQLIRESGQVRDPQPQWWYPPALATRALPACRLAVLSVPFSNACGHCHGTHPLCVEVDWQGSGSRLIHRPW